MPYLLTVFFFILFANLLGLVPYGSTATGNVSVTATLAIIAFVVIEIAGMRALGKDYIGTIFYWPHDMPVCGRILMTLIMTPVEILGKFTKPFALCDSSVREHDRRPRHGARTHLDRSSCSARARSACAGRDGGRHHVLELFVASCRRTSSRCSSASFIGQIRTAEHH